MSDSKKWHLDYSEYSEVDKGLESLGQTITHVILALIVLGVVYTFFAKTEWEPMVKSPVVKTNLLELRALDSFDGTEDENQPDEEMG